jgi:hypothetical protein
MRPRKWFAVLAALVCLTQVALAQPAVRPGPTLTFDGVETYDFTSARTARDYRLFVYTPSSPPPPDGFPVVYVLDGNAHFPGAMTSARSQSMFGEIRSAVVVGIGYPSSDFDFILRTRNKDLTTPVTAETLSRMPPNPGLTPDNTGGLDAFLFMIETEVKPFIASKVKVNAADQTLYGHSLGGLAVLRALFTTPSAYRTFVSASPSLFWNDREILKGEAPLANAISAGALRPRILVMVGELEGSHERYRTGGVPMLQSDVDALIASTQMVENARTLGERLRSLKGSEGYRADVVVFPDESHLSVIPASISRALAFALSTDGDLPPRRAPPAR